MSLDYERDCRIEHESLDVEWVQQPDLMRRYAVHAANTKRDMDDSKERLDVGRAKLEMRIRNEPEKFGLAKVTESAIASTILLQQEYQELTKHYNEARYEFDVATGVVRAIDQRKTALENLVKLLGQSYFAGPKAPRDLSTEWQKHERQRQSNAKVQIGRRKEEENYGIA